MNQVVVEERTSVREVKRSGARTAAEKKKSV